MTEYNGKTYEENDMVEYVKADGSVDIVSAKVAHGREAASKYTGIRADAKGLVRDFLSTKDFGKLPEDIQEAIKVLANAMSGKRSGNTGSELINMLRDNTISKMDLFEKFELGTPAMKTKARTWAKAGSVFVRETSDGKGWEGYSDMPEDWTGQKPVQTEEL